MSGNYPPGCGDHNLSDNPFGSFVKCKCCGEPLADCVCEYEDEEDESDTE